MKKEKALQSIWLKPVSGFGLAFLFLVIMGALGTFLRYLFVAPVAWANYKHFLHAHSHIGFLGWVYNALLALIILYFIPREKHRAPMKLFWLTQIATLGMLLFFPIQGYGRESIIFSTLHIFFSWAFAAMAWRGAKSTSLMAKAYLKLALFFMVISSLGPFAMGPLMTKGLGGSPLYYSAIYYYLHFQYNGWFIFALLALLYQYLERQNIFTAGVAALKALYLLTAGCILSLSLSILWAEKQAWLYGIAGLAGLLQLGGCYYLYQSLQPAYRLACNSLAPIVRQLLLFAAFCFLGKNLLQLGAALPAFSGMAFGVRNLIIAFLHLTFLGIVTPALLAASFLERWFTPGLLSRAAVYLFVIAFSGSQLVLSLMHAPGFTPWLAPYYAYSMLIFSAFMLLAFTVLGLGFIKAGRQQKQLQLATKNEYKLAG